MNKAILCALIALAAFTSCSKKPVQGSVTYGIEYKFPDSLKKYLVYLPKSASVYFKGDSTISIQQGMDESTTVITHKPTGFMRVLLKSASQKYQVDYSKADQAEEAAARPVYTYQASTKSKLIAGYKAQKYVLTDKATGEVTEAWFTKDVALVPNSLTTALDTAYGVPLAFISSQHGLTIKTTVKAIKFEPVAEGAFATPTGYQPLSARQLMDMPVEN